MPRKALIYSKRAPYHISARVNNREAFPGDLQYIWKVLSAELYLQTELYKIAVHAFVLMPNHFHLIVTTPEINISKSMREFLGSSTRIINSKYQRWGRLFGGRYHWTLIDDPIYYAHALKYVYRNPVKAGICSAVSDYPYSTFSGLTGRSHLPIKVNWPPEQLHRLIPQDFYDFEKRLDRPHRNEESEAIKKALRRKIFELPKYRDDRKHRSIEI